MKPDKPANTKLKDSTFQIQVTIPKLNASKPEETQTFILPVTVYWATMATSKFDLEA